MSTFETFDGLTLHYDAEGSGAPVVMLHSFGFDGRLWMGSALASALVDIGRRTIALDARGHGRSDKRLSAFERGGGPRRGELIIHR